jgi:hypothetical protein
MDLSAKVARKVTRVGVMSRAQSQIEVASDLEADAAVK